MEKNKKETLNEWAEKTESFEGYVYIAVDRGGNSFSRFISSEHVTERMMVDRMKQLVDVWDRQLKAAGK